MGSVSLRDSIRGGCIVLLACLAFAVFALDGPQARRAQLLEVDGIPLDSRAAAELTGRSGTDGRSSAISMHLSHMSPKSIDKLLKDNEKGEIDGIALDSHAMAELGGGMDKSSAHDSQEAHKKGKQSSRAQRFLDEGKQELDSRHWKAAVKLFARAKRIWKKEGNDQYHWADSLEHDVLRLHPDSKPVGNSFGGSHSGEGGARSSVRKAVKQLSSGHAFRSLYGLMRDQKASQVEQLGEGIAQKAVEEAKRVISPYRSLMAAPARTQSLSEVRFPSKIDLVISKAKKDLEREGKMELLHAKAKIVKMARELARAAASKAVRSEVRLGLPPAALEGKLPQLAQVSPQRWISNSGLSSQQARWSTAQRQQSLSAEEPASEVALGPDGKVYTHMPISEYVQRQNAQMSRSLALPSDEAHLPLTEQVHNALMREVPAFAEAAVNDGSNSEVTGGGTLGPDAQSPYSRYHTRGRFHYDLDQVQPRYPLAAPPFSPLRAQAVEKVATSPIEMREQVSGKNKVPVININLPNGQVVPPGQYYMDGSLVEDGLGHWDYVGKLVPSSPRESAV